MIRRPPRSTLFPTRRSSDLDRGHPAMTLNLGTRRVRCLALVLALCGVVGVVAAGAQMTGPPSEEKRRSEEHTSELQSRSDLVCRLLLEKKKKNNNKTLTELV